jgi:hypothetical protein
LGYSSLDYVSLAIDPSEEIIEVAKSHFPLVPGLNLYLTAWYRREEINKRAAVFFAGAVLAGAFGGIFGCEWERWLEKVIILRF